MNRRWTIRGVGERTRDAVRRACANTGMSAGEIVNCAIGEWAAAHPEVLTLSEPQSHGIELGQSLATAQRRLAERVRSLQDLMSRIQQ